MKKSNTYRGSKSDAFVSLEELLFKFAARSLSSCLFSILVLGTLLVGCDDDDSIPPSPSPSPIEDLSVTEITSKTIVLQWTSLGGQEYKVYRMNGSSSELVSPQNEVLLPQAKGEREEYEVENLSPSTSFDFVVDYRDGDKWVGSSNPVSAATDDADTIPPVQVITVTVVDSTLSSISINWKVVSDDDVNERVSMYKLSCAPSNCAQSGDVTVKTKSKIGEALSYTFNGLNPNTTYRINVWSVDEAGNVSRDQDCVTAKTRYNDVVQPEKIQPLTAVAVDDRSIRVRWINTGDDGRTGRSTRCILAYAASTCPSDTNGFKINIQNPDSAGRQQELVVSNLEPETEYNFVMWAIDDVGNQSTVSDCASASTLSERDTTPPAAVSTLMAQAENDAAIVVAWSNSGDDGTTGQAARCVLAYSASSCPIDTISPKLSVIAPGAAGTLQQIRVSNLNPSTEYSFVVWTLDEAGNMSAQSNCAKATTAQADPIWLRRVPSEYGTIQAAIDACQSGDTVLIAPGNYKGAGNQDLTFKNKGRAITIIGVEGAGSTNIDCGGNSASRHRAFAFTDDGDIIVIKGLRMSHGYHVSGGAVDCLNSSPIFMDCTFDSNSCSSNGGAVYSRGFSRARFENCRFLRNRAEGEGGAIRLESGEISLTDCLLSGNSSDSWGGGMMADDATSATFRQCTISNNRSDRAGGGGILLRRTSATFTSCTLESNRAESNGGAIYVFATVQCQFYNCTFFSNQVGNASGLNGGGAIAADGSGVHSGVTIADCRFVSNMSGEKAGAILQAGDSEVHVSNSRFEKNEANEYGGAIYVFDRSDFFDASGTQFNGNRGLYGGAIFNNGELNLNTSELDSNSTLASGRGGAIFHDSGNQLPVIDGCRFARNSATEGGAVYCEAADGDYPHFSFCLFWKNVASSFGGAVVMASGAYPRIQNCTLVENVAPAGAAIYSTNSAVPIIDRCIISGSRSGGAIQGNISKNWTFSNTNIFGNATCDWNCDSEIQAKQSCCGNKSCDPQFADPAKGDFYLKSTSCCAGANNNGIQIGAYSVKR